MTFSPLPLHAKASQWRHQRRPRRDVSVRSNMLPGCVEAGELTTEPATSSNTRRRSHETDANTEIGTGKVREKSQTGEKREKWNTKRTLAPRGVRCEIILGFVASKTVWKTVLCAIFNGILFGILSSAIRVEQKTAKNSYKYSKSRSSSKAATTSASSFSTLTRVYGCVLKCVCLCESVVSMLIQIIDQIHKAATFVANNKTRQTRQPARGDINFIFSLPLFALLLLLWILTSKGRPPINWGLTQRGLTCWVTAHTNKQTNTGGSD